MKNWAVFGKTGGLGSGCIDYLKSINEPVTGFGRSDLDFADTTAVANFDLSPYTHVINCTGTSRGTYLGFINNSVENIVSQMTVNYVNNIVLLKNFVNTNPQGHYTWIGTSLSSHGQRPFHSIYASSKEACVTATALIAQEATDFTITEARVGLVATKFRWVNFDGSRTQEEVQQDYNRGNAMTSESVAISIVDAILANKTYLEKFND
jgi:short-subunit dehydrogenase